MKHLKTILKWALPSIKAAYNLLATNAEVFCRHSFGQRYAASLLGSFFFCFVTMALLRAVEPENSSSVIDVYLLIYFILVLYHLGCMWRPRATIHSYSGGQSYEFWNGLGVNPVLIKTFFEPLIFALAGVLIYPANRLLSAWLQVAGFCMCVKEVISYWKYSNRVRDAVDARLEGERISGGVRQRTNPQSGGEPRVSPVVPVEQGQAPTSSIEQIYSRLDPALLQLMFSPNPNRTNTPPIARNVNRPNPQRYHAGPLGTLPRISSRRPQ